MPEKTLSRRNTVRVVGYLKENNLEQITNARGDQVIRGSIIIANDEINSHRIQYYVAATTKNGEESKDYKELLALLPNNTITIASFLKENPSADFKTAANAASKVWAMARFEEYAYRKGDRVTSSTTLKGFRAGFKTATDKSPFVSLAEFVVDVYINAMNNELDVETGADTGRLCIEGLLPVYDGSVNKLNLVVEKENVPFVSSNYKVGDTACFNGKLDQVEYKVVDRESNAGFGFGGAASEDDQKQYVTKFYSRRIILGNVYNNKHMAPLHDGEEGSITAQFVKNGLAARELKIDTNTSKRGMPASTTMRSSSIDVSGDFSDF